MLNDPKNQIFNVGSWLIQPDLNQISTPSMALYLRPQLMDILVYLIRQEGNIVTVEDLFKDVWSKKIVSIGNIYNCVSELRKELAKDNKNLEYIITVPKKGYCIPKTYLHIPTEFNKSSSTDIVNLLHLKDN